MPDMNDLDRRPFDGEEDAPAGASPEQQLPHLSHSYAFEMSFAADGVTMTR